MLRALVRHTIAFASSLALVVYVAIVVLWANSYFHGTHILVIDNTLERPGDHGRLSHVTGIQSGGGYVTLYSSEREDRNIGDYERDEPPDSEFRYALRLPPVRPDFGLSPWGGWRGSWGGFAAGLEVARGVHAGSDTHYVVIPFWSLCALTAPPTAALWIPLLRRLLRRRRGICPNCGYDLRASPARCPECGSTPAS